eukprot:NODE_500_length_6721_cov_0.845492.p2 type:complete len:504 gc:universal NODE_500_length_6721_cov_0.845492:3568-5079(+)
MSFRGRFINTKSAHFHNSPIMSLKFCSSHQLILMGDEKGTMHVYKDDLEHITSHLLHHQSIYSIDCSEQYFVTVSSDGQAIMSNYENYDPIGLLGDSSQCLKSVNISPWDSNRILICGKEGKISLYDIRVNPSISFGVDHFKPIKTLQNGNVSGIKYCVGKGLWQTDNHISSYGVSDKTVKLWDLRNSKGCVAENILESQVLDICKAESSIITLTEKGVILDLNNWDLSIADRWQTNLSTSQYSRLAYQESTSTLAIGTTPGELAYLCFSPISYKNIFKRSLMLDYKMGTDTIRSDYRKAPLLFKTESGFKEINAVEFMDSPYTVLTGDDLGNVRIWETERPGNDISTASLPIGADVGQIESKGIGTRFCDQIPAKKYAIESVHAFRDIDQNRFEDPLFIRSDFKKLSVAPTKAATLLTPMKKRRRTMDKELFDDKFIDDPNLSNLNTIENASPLYQSTINFWQSSNNIANENTEPSNLKRRRKKSKIKIAPLIVHDFFRTRH